MGRGVDVRGVGEEGERGHRGVKGQQETRRRGINEKPEGTVQSVGHQGSGKRRRI